jgi:hypothetical protein
MSSITAKVENGITEARILVLGAQALAGFELRAAFETGFSELPHWARALKAASLGAMLLALAFIVLPTAWHRLAERGEDTPRVHRVTRIAIGVALLPFALALGADLLVAALPVAGARAALGIGGAMLALALTGWFGVELVARRFRRPREETRMEPTTIEQKIKHVLTEARTVLPGAQMLLGFQLAAVLTEAFAQLPWNAKAIHLGATFTTALAVVLLMMPAAYHRMVERGEETEHFHRVASALVVAAIVPIALGLAADLGIVIFRAVHAPRLAIGGAAAALALFAIAWFVVPLAARRRRPRARVLGEAREAHGTA